jgi:hypothetical protein
MPDFEANEPASDSKAALEQTLGLLKARDDTSKFVGLSLLRSLLDSDEGLRTSRDVLSECWNSIPNKFLTRLMTSQPTGKTSIEESKSMVQLAVSVVHLFANLLPPEEVAKKKLTDFCCPLIQVAPSLEPELQSLAFQTLQCIAGSPSGAAALLTVKDWEGLTRAASESPQHYLKAVAMLFAVSQQSAPMTKDALENWHRRLEVFIRKLQKRDEAALIETLAELNTEFPVSTTSLFRSRLILTPNSAAKSTRLASKRNYPFSSHS